LNFLTTLDGQAKLNWTGLLWQMLLADPGKSSFVSETTFFDISFCPAAYFSAPVAIIALVRIS
jgi:hypothetical protein